MSRKLNVMWISPYVPYDTVRHAGGQTENFYLKGLVEDSEFDVFLLSFANLEELERIDLDKYNIRNRIFMNYTGKISRYFWLVINKFRHYNIFSRMGMLSVQYELYIKRFLKNNVTVEPDVVILHWTHMVLLAPYIKRIFPKTCIVCIEEDVSFQSYERMWQKEENTILKIIRKKIFINRKAGELYSLKFSDAILVNNQKDFNLLRDNGIDVDLWKWSVFFHNYGCINYLGDTKDILFYGAMDRKENYLSAIWFIENVMPLLKRYKMRFVIMGNNPIKKLYSYQNEHVIVTGFVDDPTVYFRKSLCLVAPLVLGAGIKVKILESFSAGIPVLTNKIGIEGIPAVDGKDYILCETPQDYSSGIIKLLHDNSFKKSLSSSAKDVINNSFNYHNNLKEFKQRLLLLMDK